MSLGPHRMAKSIRVEQADYASAPLIYIDGELFPYFTAPGPKVVQVERKHLPTVTITIIAEQVEVTAQNPHIVAAAEDADGETLGGAA